MGTWGHGYSCSDQATHDVKDRLWWHYDREVPGPTLRNFLQQAGGTGCRALRVPVGHEAGGAADAEEAVGDEAGAVVARVVVVRDVLVGHYQDALVGQRLPPRRGTRQPMDPHSKQHSS